ncbi:DUF6973 domain-containing protein [Sphingomonas psychrotolerans]|uniref:DUF6973 domain-containing protein n=1 Tax=Sphingomonas psychrotolerans TaxID=1327635 RepID=A0A2K8MI03_9SPHN|nr:hypothetical protein [Sphingomonas psychrotolerans]ATY32166.1 hypothetical protein CVN68_09400 [Sphingomonas psychrotolerans]
MLAIDGGGSVGASYARGPAPVTGGPDPKQVERNYQVPDDKVIEWSPSLFGFIPLGGLGGTRTITQTEGKLLDNLTRDRGLVGLNDFKNIADEAFTVSEQRVPAPGRIPVEAQRQIDALPPEDQALAARAYPKNDGHTDAFRHAYWNARLTAEFGENWTKEFTTAHEGLPGNGAVREAMDLYNNEVGRRIAVENPNASPAELADLVQKALDHGELMVVDRSGHLAPSDDVARGQHGMADPTPANGVMNTPKGDASANGS